MKDNGGQAFPVPDSECTLQEEGMTLRDYFAGQALTGLILKSPYEILDENTVEGKEKLDFMYEVMSRSAYNYADAMIKERTK